MAAARYWLQIDSKRHRPRADRQCHAVPEESAAKRHRLGLSVPVSTQTAAWWSAQAASAYALARCVFRTNFYTSTQSPNTRATNLNLPARRLGDRLMFGEKGRLKFLFAALPP